MLIEQAICDEIKATAVVAALVVDRVEVDQISKGTPDPCISVTRVGTERTYTTTQQDGLVGGRFQVVVWAKSYAEAKAICELMRPKFSPFVGMMGARTGADPDPGVDVESVFWDDEGTMFDAETKSRGYRVDWTVNYREP